MRIVATGTFRSPNSGQHFTREQVVQLCAMAGWTLDSKVTWNTDMIYAENVQGNSTKLRDARNMGKTIYSYNRLYEDLTARLTALNNGTATRPELALIRYERYGRNWRESNPSREYVQPVAPAKLTNHDDQPTPKGDIRPVATVGSLTIRRNVRI